MISRACGNPGISFLMKSVLEKGLEKQPNISSFNLNGASIESPNEMANT